MNTASRTGAFCNVKTVIGRDFSEAMHILWPDEVANQIVALSHETLETREPYYSEEGLEAISRNAHAQTELIEDLLDMSRIINGKIRLDIQKVTLREVVGEATTGVSG